MCPESRPNHFRDFQVVIFSPLEMFSPIFLAILNDTQEIAGQLSQQFDN